MKSPHLQALLSSSHIKSKFGRLDVRAFSSKARMKIFNERAKKTRTDKPKKGTILCFFSLARARTSSTGSIWLFIKEKEVKYSP
jgi:hypothetical protein